MPRSRIDVNLDELDRVLDGAREAPLSETDYDKLKGALHALAAHVGAPAQYGEDSAVLGKPEAPEYRGASGQQRSVTRSRTQWSRGIRWCAQSGNHASTLKHGDRCPECAKGNVYGQKEPRVLVRIVGQAPLAATAYSLERLRCGACGQVFTAQEPEGVGPEKYDETAAQ